MKAGSPLFIHYVHDMDRAIGFYRGVFELEPTFVSPGWTTFSFDVFDLALHILTPDHDDQVIPNAGLNLLVESIEAFAELAQKAGGRLLELREPDSFVPVRVASFVDSEGNGFELRQEVASGS